MNAFARSEPTGRNVRGGPLGRSRRIAALGLGIAILIALAAPLGAFAAYPPGPFPGPAPGGSFQAIVTSVIVCPEGDQVKATYGAATLTLNVPAGAFDACTQVTVYAADEAVVGALLPAAMTLVDAFAVGWDAASSAAVPLTLTIGDPAITSNATAFATTATGVLALDAVPRSGSVALELSTPMGFAIAVPTSSPEATPPATSTAPPIAVTEDGGLPWLGGLVLVLLAGLAFLLPFNQAPARRDR